MSAQIFPAVKSLLLVIPNPVRPDGSFRDDLIGVKVWYSTASASFDAEASGVLAYEGDGLNITLPNLTSGTTYYVKYALISIIDPTDYTISSALSAAPLAGVAVDVRLSNPNTQVPASTTGVVSSYSGSGTNILVFEGATQLNYIQYPLTTDTGYFKVEYSLANIAVPIPYIEQFNQTTARALDITSLTADSGAVTFTISGKGVSGETFSITTTQTITKAKATPTPYIDISGLSSFNLSSDGVYSPSTATLSAITENIINPTYSWTVTGATPTSGTSSSITITPTTNRVIYIVLQVNGDNLPSPLSKTVSTTISYDGAPGPSIDISGIGGFKINAGGTRIPDSATLTAISRFVTSPTYSWTVTNGTYTTVNPTQISVTPSSQNPVTVTLTVTGTNLTEGISKSIVLNTTLDGVAGQAGANGTMSAFPAIYQWTTSSTPPARPTTTSTYTWSSGDYTAPTNWSTTAPTNTTPGSYLWVLTVPLVVSATVTQSTIDWTATSNAIKAISYNGSNGTNGTNGTDGTNGTNGTDGAPGSATFVVTRTANDSSAPTNAEVTAAIGRTPVAGDIATVNYNSGNLSAVYKYTTAWALFTSYITGSLIVQNSITAANMATGTITAASGVIGSLNADVITSGTITGRTYQTTSDLNAARRITINESNNNQIQVNGALGTVPETYGRLANFGEVSVSYPQYLTGTSATSPAIGEFGRSDSARVGLLARAYRAPAIYVEARQHIGLLINNRTSEYNTTEASDFIFKGLTYGIAMQRSCVGISMVGNGADNIWFPLDISNWGGYFSNPLNNPPTYQGTGVFIGGPRYASTKGWSLLVTDSERTNGTFATGYGLARIGGSSLYGGGICFGRDGWDLVSASVADGTSVSITSTKTYTALSQGWFRSNNSRLDITKGVLAIDVQSSEVTPQYSDERSNYIINHTTSPTYLRPLGHFPGLYINPVNSSSTTPELSTGKTGITVDFEVYAYVSRYCLYGTYMQGSVYDHYAAGSGVNYGPFTGSHDGLLLKDSDISAGDIVIDKQLVTIKNTSNSIFINEISSVPMDKRAVGVYVMDIEYDIYTVPAAMENLSEDKKAEIVSFYKRIAFNAVGEGAVNVCNENGNIEAGDLICTSSLPGKGMRQADDIVRNYTVARARNSVTWQEGDTSIKQVACIYLCG